MTHDLKHIVRAQDSGARLARCFKSEVLRRYQNYQSFMTVQTFAIFSHLRFSFPLSLPLSTTTATYHFVCLHSAVRVRPSVLLLREVQHRFKGPFIKDVCTEGGKGLRNLQILRTNSTDRLCEMRTRGREGSKNPKFLWTSFMDGPYASLP